MSKRIKSKDKLVHIRLEDGHYNKLAKEAKTHKRSVPNMVRYFLERYLEKNIDLDFSDEELHKIQSIGGIYSDLEDEVEIYSEKDIKPIKWD